MRASLPTVSPARLTWVVVWISAAVLGLEISLMRVLAVASWHHFAFAVISVVLLGFGASGTALSILRPRLPGRGESVLFALALATSISMPLCLTLAQHVPIEARFVPALFWRQVGLWLAYWAILALPFFAGAAAICLTLMLAGDRVAAVYGGNLIGSAAGAVLATLMMHALAPAWLSVLTAGLALVGTAGLIRRPVGMRAGLAVIGVAAVSACLWMDRPGLRVDPYKYGAYVARLERQGAAQRVAFAYGPRALVEAYRSDVFHDLPFLSGGTAPPPMFSLLVDGYRAGSILRIDHPADAAVMDDTLMAFPYALATGKPRVLLLGETGGVNVWLAARRGASLVDVVQPDANIVSLVCGLSPDDGGGVLDLPGVRVTVGEPRHFVEHAAGRFDLIQLVALQSGAAGSGGMGGLGQDHLITVGGMAACLRRLDQDGVLFACRGMQTPPRDNVKLLATLVAALRTSGVDQPAGHVVIVRDFQAVCTMVKASPWTRRQIDLVRRLCVERNLTPVWFDGITPDELNHPDVLPGPPDSRGDWYYHAATRLFGPASDRFIDDWAFDVRPPTDDRPFFLDFFRQRSIGQLKRAFGDLWLTRAEMGFLFAAAAAVITVIVGAALTLLPLAFFGRTGGAGGRAAAAAYFGAIGLAYLLLEMTFLSRVTRLIGDPVTAAAVTISAFLLMSGVGSLTAQRLGQPRAGVLPRIVLGLVAVGAVALLAIGPLSAFAGDWPMVARSALAILIIAPLGYLMGFPMPTALARLERGAPAQIPWAWGINGFASVLATPLATIMGMTWGFKTAAAAALGLYLVAGMTFGRLRSAPEATNCE